MREFRNGVGAGAALAGLLGICLVSAAHAQADISGIWWATTYSPKILVLGGGDPPLNAAGQAQYTRNRAGLTDGSLVDKARIVCVPDGVPRVLETPYPFEIFQVPKGQVTTIHELNHQLRVIALDKPLRKYEDVMLFANFNGFSVGHWDGDTLVIETIGFNEDTFLDSTGLPHSDEMVTTERVRRINGNQLEDVITIHDPSLYARDWQSRFVYEQRNDIRMQDFSCNDATHRDISHVQGVNEARAARAGPRCRERPWARAQCSAPTAGSGVSSNKARRAERTLAKAEWQRRCGRRICKNGPGEVHHALSKNALCNWNCRRFCDDLRWRQSG